MLEIRITTVEDLMAFVAIIRGEERDFHKIIQLTRELNKDTNDLLEAEKKDSQTK